MKKIIISCVFLILFLPNFCYSWEIKLIKKIPIKDKALFHSVGFAVLEDGTFLFTDLKDKANQLKIFDEEGKLIWAWGKMGPGPDEFWWIGILRLSEPISGGSRCWKTRNPGVGKSQKL
ncbi:MAG: hypothetical protein QME85_00960 [Candidatus Saccharicenans sp.]|nr:hypothetical protein [Candidatus Saccharicenans sp.]